MKTFNYKMALYNAFSGLLIGLALLGGSLYAIQNQWGLTVYGGGLPAEQAQYIYMVLIGLGAIILIFSIALFRIGTRVIQIDDKSILVPKSELSKKMISINFEDIHDIGIESYNNIYSLNIHHSQGVTKLRSVHFGSIEAFDEFCNLVEGYLKK